MARATTIALSLQASTTVFATVAIVGEHHQNMTKKK
jgi:hypothetical protein